MQLWLGGSPDQTRTGTATDIFKMPFDKLEETVEPIFAMYKTQRIAADEVTNNVHLRCSNLFSPASWRHITIPACQAFGDFCHRVGWPQIKEFMESYKPGDHASMADPFAPGLIPTPDSSIGIDSSLLSKVEAEASARGLNAATLLDTILRDALEG
ncbi:MAG: hypothetical protein SGPRY_007661 [Prymnesium sp.]